MTESTESEYSFAKRSSDWIVSANCGGQDIVAYNLRTHKKIEFRLQGQSALSIDINSSGCEIYVLSEDTVKDSDSDEDIKQVVILRLEDEALTELDQIKVFPKAKVLTSLGKSEYILIEGLFCVNLGDQYFNLLSTNNTKLAEDIVNGLYASNRSEAEAPEVLGNDQNSTKGNTNGNSPIPEENSNPNSEPNKLDEARILSSVDKCLDQRVTDDEKSTQMITIDQKRLAEIIDERLKIFKEQIKMEILAELQETIRDGQTTKVEKPAKKASEMKESTNKEVKLEYKTISNQYGIVVTKQIDVPKA